MRTFALPCPVFLVLTIAGCYVGPGEGSGLEGATEGSGTDGATTSASEASTGTAGSTAASTSATTTTTASTSAGSTSVDPSETTITSEATTTESTTSDVGTTGVDTSNTTSTTTSGASTTGTSDPSTTATSEDPSTSGGGDLDGVCERWTMDRQDLAEGTWSGNTMSCEAGDIGAPGRANALKLINLYRWLAGLPAVSADASRNDKAQRCALMMHANGQLSHSPPMNWKCYSAEGAEAAGKSNIAGTAGVTGVDLYMADPGNTTTLGHRRWILSNGLGPVGLGSTSSYSCMWVIGGNGGGNNQFTAWPSPGEFPLQAMTASWKSVDETGWSIQSNSIDLKGAQVTITRDGQSLPVTVNQLLPNYGSTSAISIIPQGWTSQAGETYAVAVSGVNPPINYEVHFLDCQ